MERIIFCFLCNLSSKKCLIWARTSSKRKKYHYRSVSNHLLAQTKLRRFLAQKISENKGPYVSKHQNTDVLSIILPKELKVINLQEAHL